MLRSIAAAALFAAAFTALAGRDADLRDWPEGPIRYILTREEKREYRKLEGDLERSAYIERFWARRDPDPATIVNEYRQFFWERVREANRQFVDSAYPGWKTDRGKIYILYGPPNEVQRDDYIDAGREVTSGRGLIRWIYDGRPGGRRDLDAVTVVPFVRDVSGEWRVSHDPQLASIFFDWMQSTEPYLKDRAGVWQQVWQGVGRSELSVMLDLGKMQEVPPAEAVLIERIETQESFGADPLDVVVQRYEGSGAEEGTVVSLTVAAPGREGTRPAVLARFEDAEGPRPQRLLGEGSFRYRGDGNARVAQARIEVPPGRWTLTVIRAEPSTARAAIYNGTVVSPPPDGTLRVGDAVLTTELESLPYFSLATYTEPFVVGAFRFVPRLGDALRAGEPVQIFHEVYGGAPPYRIEYRVEGLDLDGSWVPLGPPAIVEGSQGQGWEFPTTSRWPPGEYRVRIRVEDGAGATAGAFVPFRIETGEAS